MRISATVLESFRLFMTEDWMDEAALLAAIRGPVLPTAAMALGLAFGHVLETPARYRVPGGFRCGLFSWSDATLAPVFALIDRRGVFEVKATKAYGECTVVAKADYVLGSELTEFKTTDATFHFEKYADSYQWRFMADIFEPRVITYHVFQVNDHGNGVVDVTGINSFHVYPYAALHEDCDALLRQFVTYVTARSVDGVLRERHEVMTRAGLQM